MIDDDYEDDTDEMESEDDVLNEVHARIMRNNSEAQDQQREIRLQALADRKLATIRGAGWEGNLEQQYKNRPKPEVNKIHTALRRIEAEYRNNRFTVDFISANGVDDDNLADLCDGLYRSDEQFSVAKEAYDNAYHEAVYGGMGAWRLTHCYEDDDDYDQEYQTVKILPIVDADTTVFFDLNAKRYDKSDAKWALLLHGMTYDAYKEEWGDDPATFPKPEETYGFTWWTSNIIYVAEYFEIEESKDWVYTFEDISGNKTKYTARELKDDPELKKSILALGGKQVSKRKIETCKVHKYIVNGQRVLEDCGYIAGENIPIVPMYCERSFIDGVEYFSGFVKDAVDTQRSINMIRAKIQELVASSSFEKPILTPGMIQGHENYWATDNIENFSYLLLNPVMDQNGNEMIPQLNYTRSPQIPPAIIALAQMTEQDMVDLLGQHEQGEKMVSNISAKAISLIQDSVAMISFVAMSNMAQSMARCGEIWLSMKRDITREKGRKMRVVSRNNDVSTVELYKPSMRDGKPVIKNDLQNAKFKVVAEAGASSTSRRKSTVESLMQMMAIPGLDPQTIAILSTTAMMNMEGEGLSEMQDYWRNKLIQLGVLKPNEKEAAAMAEEQANQQPDPSQVLAQAEAGRIVALTKESESKTALNMANTKKAMADTHKTIVDAAAQQLENSLIQDTTVDIKPITPGPSN